MFVVILKYESYYRHHNMRLLALVGLLTFVCSESGNEAPEEMNLPHSLSILNITTWDRLTQSNQFLLTVNGLAEKKFERTICNDFVFGEILSIRAVRNSYTYYKFWDIDQFTKAREGESFSGYKL